MVEGGVAITRLSRYVISSGLSALTTNKRGCTDPFRRLLSFWEGFEVHNSSLVVKQKKSQAKLSPVGAQEYTRIPTDAGDSEGSMQPDRNMAPILAGDAQADDRTTFLELP